MRLVDFQIYVRPPGLTQDQEQKLNEAVFPIFEAVRLRVKEEAIVAPFRKILVSIEDRTTAAQWHGKPSVALGICEVTQACDIQALVQHCPDFCAYSTMAIESLAHIAGSLGWRNESLEDTLRRTAVENPPCSHRFGKLQKIHKKTGIVCDVFFFAGHQFSSVSTCFTDGDRRIQNVVVYEKPGPVYMEDDFPVVSSAITGSDFALLDRTKRTLASVPIPDCRS